MPNLTWLYAGAITPPASPLAPRRRRPAETHRLLFLRARPALFPRAADDRHDQRAGRLLRVAAAVGERDQASASGQSIHQRRRAATGAVGARGARALARIQSAAVGADRRVGISAAREWTEPGAVDPAPSRAAARPRPRADGRGSVEGADRTDVHVSLLPEARLLMTASSIGAIAYGFSGLHAGLAALRTRHGRGDAAGGAVRRRPAGRARHRRTVRVRIIDMGRDSYRRSSGDRGERRIAGGAVHRLDRVRRAARRAPGDSFAPAAEASSPARFWPRRF